MKTRTRRAFTIFQLLVILAFLAIAFALLLPAIAKVRVAAARSQSTNNMHQIGIALQSYHDSEGALPPGNDDNNFSGLAKILPYLEQGNVYNTIDFKKPIDDKANAAARKTVIATYHSPLDMVKSVSEDYGATSYLLCAGSQPALADNNGICSLNSKVTLVQISAANGTSNTIMVGETLIGDSGVKATTVKRQHVLLKKEDLKGIKDEAGVKEWEKDKNIAADRGASWLDGRFLQSTFTGTRTLNDEKPDVNCAGLGGLSGLRSNSDGANILFADAHVGTISSKVKLEVWQAVTNYKNTNPVPNF